MQIGPALESMNGPIPLPYSELAAYESVSGVPFTAFEADLIRTLSRVWCGECAKAREHDAPPPYVETPSEASRAAIGARLRDVMRGRMDTGERRAGAESEKQHAAPGGRAEP